MRKSIFLLLLVSALSSPIASAATEPPPPDVKGLWLTADFPAATLRAGEEARFTVSLINYERRQSCARGALRHAAVPQAPRRAGHALLAARAAHQW